MILAPKRSTQEYGPCRQRIRSAMPPATRLFLLCESCGVCRQHLLSIPKNALANALSAAKCVTCDKTTWLRVKPAGKSPAGTLQEKLSVIRCQHQSKAAKPPAAVSTHHPRTAALLAYARRAIEHRSRVLEARYKASVPANMEAMRAASDLRREIQLATKRLDDYAPDTGVESCPKCFVFNNASVVLLPRQDPIVQSKSVVVTCPACGFVGSIPSL